MECRRSWDGAGGREIGIRKVQDVVAVEGDFVRQIAELSGDGYANLASGVLQMYDAAIGCRGILRHGRSGEHGEDCDESGSEAVHRGAHRLQG